MELTIDNLKKCAANYRAAMERLTELSGQMPEIENLAAGYDQAAMVCDAHAAAVQALTDMGCELREGVWTKPCGLTVKDYRGDVSYCKGGRYGEGDCRQCLGTGWLPINRKSGGEGGAG